MARPHLILQLGGWALVAGIYFAMDVAPRPAPELVSPPANAEGGLGLVPPIVSDGAFGVVPRRPLGELLAADTLLAAAGCLVSFALWAIYRRVPLPDSRVAMAAGAILGTIVGALAWELLARFSSQRAPRETLAGSLMLKLFILAAWHGVAFAEWQALQATQALARAARAERLALEARLEALRYQLNPHFLFNALNSAIAMIDEAPERAQTMLTLLSDLLRDTLSDVGSTTLAVELALVARYIAIERVRYEEKLQFDLECTDQAGRCLVPRLLVHSLVENAVKHGMRSSSPPLRVRLRCALDGEWLRIDVVNSGRRDSGDGGGGIGLRNVEQRLAALYPARHRFALEAHDGQVRASVALLQPERA
jgi:hypothetical protein